MCDCVYMYYMWGVCIVFLSVVRVQYVSKVWYV